MGRQGCGRPAASLAARGKFLVDQEGRQAGAEGQGPQGALPGRHRLPGRRRAHADPRPRAHRVQPPDAAGRRRLAAHGQRPLARRLRLLPLRRPGTSSPATSKRSNAARPVRQHRLPAHRHPQPRRRRHPLAPVHVGRGRRATPCSACSSRTTASSSPTTRSLDDVATVRRTPSSRRPTGSTLDEYVEGETQCNGEDAELSVKVWNSYTDTDSGNRYIANMDRVHIDNDGMVFAISFTPRDADQVMPPWAADLPAARRRRHEPGPAGRPPIETGTTATRHVGTASTDAGDRHADADHHGRRRDRGADHHRRLTPCTPSSWSAASAPACARSRTTSRSRCCRSCTGR